MASDLTSEEPEGGKVRFASGDGAPARSSTGGLSGGVEQCDGEPRGVPENQRERGEAVAGERCDRSGGPEEASACSTGAAASA